MLKRFLQDGVPKPMRLIAAAGMMPLQPADLLRLLVHLAHDPDPEVLAKAAGTLSGWAEADIVSQLQSSGCDPEVIEHFSSCGSAAIQEAVILNAAAPGGIIAAMAASVPAPLLEAVLYNRTRILEFPEILEAVKRNPAATPQILGLVQEIETEFFGGKDHSYTAVGAEPEEPAGEFPVQELVPGLETEEDPGDLILEGLPIDPQEREAALQSRIGSMTVRQKIKLALMGTREARAVLIRDTNREVSRSVMTSPKLTLSEIESFAGMRTVSEDILRAIGNSKAWTKSYAVVHNLVRNPKTPALISQRMILRIQTRDLMLLARDRGIPEAVRRSADRTVKQRTQQVKR